MTLKPKKCCRGNQALPRVISVYCDADILPWFMQAPVFHFYALTNLAAAVCIGTFGVLEGRNPLLHSPLSRDRMTNAIVILVLP